MPLILPGSGPHGGLPRVACIISVYIPVNSKIERSYFKYEMRDGHTWPKRLHPLFCKFGNGGLTVLWSCTACFFRFGKVPLLYFFVKKSVFTVRSVETRIKASLRMDADAARSVW